MMKRDLSINKVNKSTRYLISKMYSTKSTSQFTLLWSRLRKGKFQTRRNSNTSRLYRVSNSKKSRIFKECNNDRCNHVSTTDPCNLALFSIEVHSRASEE